MHLRENYPIKDHSKTLGVMILQGIFFKKAALTWNWKKKESLFLEWHISKY